MKYSHILLLTSLSFVASQDSADDYYIEDDQIAPVAPIASESSSLDNSNESIQSDPVDLTSDSELPVVESDYSELSEDDYGTTCVDCNSTTTIVSDYTITVTDTCVECTLNQTISEPNDNFTTLTVVEDGSTVTVTVPCDGGSTYTVVDENGSTSIVESPCECEKSFISTESDSDVSTTESSSDVNTTESAETEFTTVTIVVDNGSTITVTIPCENNKSTHTIVDDKGSTLTVTLPPNESDVTITVTEPCEGFESTVVKDGTTVTVTLPCEDNTVLTVDNTVLTTVDHNNFTITLTESCEECDLTSTSSESYWDGPFYNTTSSHSTFSTFVTSNLTSTPPISHDSIVPQIPTSSPDIPADDMYFSNSASQMSIGLVTILVLVVNYVF